MMMDSFKKGLDYTYSSDSDKYYRIARNVSDGIAEIAFQDIFRVKSNSTIPV